MPELRAALCGCLLLGACGGDDAPPSIAASADRTTLPAGEQVILTVTVERFTLVDPGTSPPNRSGEGHYHVYLDDATGADYLVADAGATTDVTIPEGTAAGAHTLRVELQQNDHTPVAGTEPAEIAITIEQPAPTLSVTISPTTVPVGEDLTIDLMVTDFILDPAAIGSMTNVPGRGHYHIDIDGTYQQNNGLDPSVWTVVTTDPPQAGELMMQPGPHTITISLRENNHDEISPPVRQDVSITVE